MICSGECRLCLIGSPRISTSALQVQPSPASIEIKSTIFVPSDALEAFERFLSDKPEYTLEEEEKKIVRDTL